MDTTAAQKNLKLRYRVGYVLGWAAIVICMFTMYYDAGSSITYQLEYAFVLTSVSMPPFFVTAYVLIPNLLYKKKIWLFIGSIVLTVLGFGVAGWLVCRLIYHFITGNPAIPDMGTAMRLFNVIMWDNFIGVALGSALKIISDRFRMEKKLHAVEKEKIITELNFLRSQVNPHFLFNIMNTIYFQIDRENTSARKSVETLSEMLRYQLYECNSDKIEIEKEIAYIKNYVAIQTLRMEKGSNIQLNIEPKLSGFRLAPLMIQPLVENAFKHVSTYKEPEKNRIEITLAYDQEDDFVISVSNTYDLNSNSSHLMNAHGLGIQNLRRRLELLYPEKHLLEVAKDNDVYKTVLKIRHDD